MGLATSIVRERWAWTDGPGPISATDSAILLRRTLRPSIVFSVKTHAIFDALITKTVPLSRVYNVLEHNQRPSLTSSCS